MVIGVILIVRTEGPATTTLADVLVMLEVMVRIVDLYFRYWWFHEP